MLKWIGKKEKEKGKGRNKVKLIIAIDLIIRIRHITQYQTVYALVYRRSKGVYGILFGSFLLFGLVVWFGLFIWGFGGGWVLFVCAFLPHPPSKGVSLYGNLQSILSRLWSKITYVGVGANW